MAWKSFWQIRRERQAEQQRAAAAWYPPPPQFPWSVEAKSFVELATRILPEMREHHVRNATAKPGDAASWRLEQHYRHTPLTMERLPCLMPVDLATLQRWRKRKLFYPHFGRHTEFTAETIYADLLRTCGTPADWSEDLPTRLRDRDKKKAQRKHGTDQAE
jgi:hypothetical protein